MANKLYIEEYSGTLADAQRNLVLPIPNELLAVQEVTISGVSAQSAAFNAETRFIRMSADVAAKFLTGADPTAVDDATCRLLRAGADRDLIVEPGHKIAVIAKA